MIVSDLKANPNNPRTITDSKLDLLKNAMIEFGDLSGVVFNRRSKQLVGAHQRLKVMPNSAKITIEKKYAKPTKSGTVAVGFVTFNGERFAYREVDFSLQKEMAANIAANKGAGEWDFAKLGDMMKEIQVVDFNFDMTLTMFDSEELGQFKDVTVAEHSRSLAKTEEEVVEIKNMIFSVEAIVDNAFKYFRANGFPYPDLTMHQQQQELNLLANLPAERLINSTVGYKIADTYNKHRFEASAQNMKSPMTAFNNDKDLKKAITWQIENGGRIDRDLFGTLSIVNGTQACSNFRPAFARYLYEKFCPKGGVVFDSSTGYGGRLVGFLASHCSKYIGVDPNVLTYKGNLALAKALSAGKLVKLINQPIEDVVTLPYLQKCDFAFTSPPYFTKELYSSDKTQSCVRYPKYEDWINGFLKPMLKKQFDVLKKGSINIVNIEDVKIGSTEFKLVEPTIEIAKQIGFSHEGNESFALPSRTFIRDGAKVTEDSAESVIILKKKA